MLLNNTGFPEHREKTRLGGFTFLSPTLTTTTKRAKGIEQMQWNFDCNIHFSLKKKKKKKRNMMFSCETNIPRWFEQRRLGLAAEQVQPKYRALSYISTSAWLLSKRRLPSS